MASLSTGSPKLTKRSSANFVVLDQGSADGDSGSQTASGQPSVPLGAPNPLQTDKLANASKSASMESKIKSDTNTNNEHITAILARIAQAEKEREQEKNMAAAPTMTPKKMGPLSHNLKPYPEAEMMSVKQELAAAKSLIDRQEQELAKSRSTKYLEPSQNIAHVDSIDSLGQAHNSFATGSMFTQAQPWQTRKYPREDSRSDNSDGLSADLNRARGVWSAANQSTFGSIGEIGSQSNDVMGTRNGSVWPMSMGMNTQNALVASHRVLSGPSVPTHGFEGRYSEEPPQFNLGAPRRTASQITRPNTGYSSAGIGNASFGNASFGRGTTPYGGNGYGGMSGSMAGGMAPPMNPFSFGNQLAHPRPIGTSLSPTAMEFTGNNLGPNERPFSAMSNVSNSTYFSPTEPMNYRSLLDKTVNCDWKYIVDKIVCSNDQQASIFLQQKLKVGNAEQKFEIIEAIVQQAYPLMVNRFGNFLVQRCFEHGTPDQVVKISSAIRGNVLALSTDAFGCHVIQKAFDSVPENHKADMVRELLRRIPETVIHRYACHVWQKLFELRWSGEPPQIMVKVNEALRGMWHEVALGETGSLVVQNIFENCVEEEKRPAINEVIVNIDLISHGQFGNWCIQHLCEHGSPSDKRRVIDHILAKAYSYSIDQFASKVVEKCLKIGGPEFMDSYLGEVTTAHPDRPRIPLIDIAGDQYGNYLVQWILMNSHAHQRDQVAGHIRKHMVSLRGSKFGSRVAMLCCNPASVTRPGPGVIMNPFGVPGQPRSGAWSRYR